MIYEGYNWRIKGSLCANPIHAGKFIHEFVMLVMLIKNHTRFKYSSTPTRGSEVHRLKPSYMNLCGHDNKVDVD